MQQHPLDHETIRPASNRTKKDRQRVPTVLIADDSILQRMTTRSLLESEGYSVLEAGDGREVLELVHLSHPDLILMDVAMPTMDGLTATRRLRESGEGSQVPIVFLTALGAASDRETALAAGANGYLVKPVSDRELMRVVHRFC